jgi:dCTP diphosphatase
LSDFTSLLEQLRQFRDERDWAPHHTPRNLAAAIAVEAAELQELFLWTRDDQQDSISSERRSEIEDELADVLIFALNLANVLEIDPAVAIETKIEKNRRRYPPVSEKELREK